MNLPIDVIKYILRLVSSVDRAKCAQVCSSWQIAAQSATLELSNRRFANTYRLPEDEIICHDLINQHGHARTCKCTDANKCKHPKIGDMILKARFDFAGEQMKIIMRSLIGLGDWHLFSLLHHRFSKLLNVDYHRFGIKYKEIIIWACKYGRYDIICTMNFTSRVKNKINYLIPACVGGNVEIFREIFAEQYRAPINPKRDYYMRKAASAAIRYTQLDIVRQLISWGVGVRFIHDSAYGNTTIRKMLLSEYKYAFVGTLLNNTHILDTNWNPSGNYQAVSRSIRINHQ